MWRCSRPLARPSASMNCFCSPATTTTTIATRHTTTRTHAQIYHMTHRPQHFYFYLHDGVSVSFSYLHQNVRSISTTNKRSSSSRSHQQSTTEEKVETKKKKLRTWEESFQLLVSYKEKHGNCNVPNRYKEDRRLGTWVNNQRKRKDSISDEKRVKLDGLGFTWSNELRDQQWEEMFQQLQRYAELNNGDCNVPRKDVDDNDGNWSPLYMWLREQRNRKHLLSEERRTRLDELGLIWEDAHIEKADQKWNDMHEHLKQYKQKFGDCRVPQIWDEDPSLGRWVSEQRQKYKKGQLRKDRHLKLEQMDFTWKVRDVSKQPDYEELDMKWNHQYEKLRIFRKEHNGNCNVPRYYKKDKSLASWVNQQRAQHKNGTLREDRKELLDSIDFIWNFVEQREEQWNEKYQALKQFKETNNHLRLPTGSTLSGWANLQRVQFRSGKVSLKRKALLDEINFRW